MTSESIINIERSFQFTYWAMFIINSIKTYDTLFMMLKLENIMLDDVKHIYFEDFF